MSDELEKTGKKWVALLDKNNILIGYDENPIEIRESDILVPENCDLIPGRYKWTGETFWPLGTIIKLRREKLLRELPDCFYSLVKENPEIKISANVSAWIQEYEAILEKEKK